MKYVDDNNKVDKTAVTGACLSYLFGFGVILYILFALLVEVVSSPVLLLIAVGVLVCVVVDKMEKMGKKE